MRLILIGMILLSGCQQPIQTFESIYANYSIGVPRTASIGSPLIKISNGRYATVFVHEAQFTTDIEFRPYKNYLMKDVVRIKKGDVYRTYRDYGLTMLLLTTSNAKKPIFLFIEKNGLLKSILDERMDQNTIVSTIPQDTLFKKLWDKELLYNEFSYELVLTEIANDKIHAIYREYSSDVIRPAFSYPVVFNLNESRILRFQNIVIEVLEIGDNRLVYKVIEEI